MRLTLRTMLAYLDGQIKDPAAAQDLGARIEESEAASAIAQRIRNCPRRLRLRAPAVEGKGLGLDANTVAEYIDSTMPEERVREFETVCLESDVHLAEVAACHQILALLLPEPAEVAPEMRERLYRLGRQAATSGSPAGAHAAVEPAAPPVAAAQSTGTPAAEAARPAISLATAAEVPEYVRIARRSSWRPILATAILTVLLFTAAMMALGNLDEHHPVLGWLFAGRSVEQTAAVPAAATGEDRTDEGRQQADQEPVVPSSGRAAEPGPAPEPAATSSDSTAPTESSSTADRVPAIDRAGSAEAGASADTPPAIDPARPVATEPAPAAGASAPPAVPPPVDDAAASETPATSANTAEPGGSQPETRSADAEDVGRYVGSERRHVLGRLDPVRGGWYRLPEREVLSAGDTLLALPSYRPQIALASGIQCLLVGPTSMQLGPRDAAGIPLLIPGMTNALLDTAGVAGSQVALRVCGRMGVLVFATADATLAVETRRRAAPGASLEAGAGLTVCRLMVQHGQFEWREEGQPALTIQPGQELLLVDGEATQRRDVSQEELPPWTHAPELGDIELRAARDLEALLDVERPLSLSLHEQVAHRQIEVASLAVIALCASADFEPAIALLRSAKHHAYWAPLVEAIQTALVNVPDASLQLQGVLQRTRPDQAELLYRLLLGYSNEQLAAGDDEKLVKLLEHPALDVRVLAMENLRRITGRTHLYRAEKDPQTQRRPLQDWRTNLSKGLIRWP